MYVGQHTIMSILNINVVCFSEMVTSIYQIRRRHGAETHNIK
jgi:hypothetical protein